MKKKYQITAQGKAELENELVELKEQRSEIAEKIAAARDYGDLSENAEYDAAREEQGIVESRVVEIEDILQNFELIHPKKGGNVHVGSTVELENGTSVTYQVVGSVEADPLEGKISDESPIGAALMGKKAGDKVTIETPKGQVTYTIQLVH
ncbi:transcription elongation factor GreA [Candidatus Saccharibacteria bacterium]|nr:transcription elongation factor GreA [Candidatus Saccharibacteria bacterium]NCU40276.1 transcription elongation factor GreA [Candidatus Saccharibacteria bacterium]